MIHRSSSSGQYRFALSTAVLGAVALLAACGGGDKATPAPSGSEALEVQCKDGLDNDRDGKFDCDDVDCQSPGGDCTTAPVLDRTVASTLAESAAYLYTGTNPIQRDADAKVFDAKRLAMLHGRVSDPGSQPLAGVRVSVRGHKEYGYTFTRADGSYDLAANGGARLLLEYSLDGYLPAQRTSQPGWERHVYVDDLGMVAAQAKVSSILSESPEPQAITGDAVNDAHGKREPLVVFEAGTQAHAVLSDGTKTPLSGLTVSVTEYPISSSNRFLPGTPMASTGPSYALEFEVAEAKELGALHVEFSQPISLYVENFAGLPVGSSLPLSTYDRVSGQWERGAAGHVIQVVSNADGVVAVDSDGDGLGDETGTLAAIGVKAGDLKPLAGRYPVGTQLWHGTVPHFSTALVQGLLNAPKGAWAPNPPSLRDSTPDRPSRAGSVLVEPRAVQHGIAITGTPYTLQYQGTRARGYGDAYQVELPLTGATLPPGLKRVTYQVRVAGKLYEGSVAPEANKVQPVRWDGKDNQDRFLQSPQLAEVYIGYVYDGVTSSGAAPAPPQEIVLGDTFSVKMGLWDAKSYNLGGFGLDVLHAYDPAVHTVYFGYGDQRSGESTALITKPTNLDPDFSLGTPDGVFVAPDGSLLITDDQQQDSTALGKILRITPDGKPSVLAGPGASGAAAAIELGQPQGIVALDDGSMIVSDSMKNAIRHIDANGAMTTLVSGNAADSPQVLYTLSSADGIALGLRQELYVVDSDRVLVLEAGKISTFAGGGTDASDGVIATDALLQDPSGVAVTRSGTVYISERAGHRIRKVLADGTLRTVAGTGTAGFSGDGMPAATAQLNGPRGLALGPDGSLYVADQGNDRIRRITADGIMLTVMGGGKNPPAEGNLAIEVTLDRPDGMAIAPDGTLFVASATNVFKVVSGIEQVGAQDNLIPSSDGLSLYRFDYRGKHLSTIDAMTGVTVLTFGYDAAGLLAQVTDRDGLITTISRDTSGNPTSIVGPYGQVTKIELLGSDVAKVIDPLGRTVQLNWDPATGLLGNVIDPTQKQTTFAYDPIGRLTDVRDPTDQADLSSAPSQHFDSVVTADGFLTTTEKSKAGKITEYRVRRGADETWEHSLRQVDGSTTSTKESMNIVESVAPDGTKVTQYRVVDVVFRSQSMVPIETLVTLPSGRFIEYFPTMRWKTLSDYKNILSLDTWRDEVTVNGRSYNTAYSRANNTVTTTTPMGRTSTTTLDSLGRPVSIVAAGMPTVNWTYDEDGRVATVTQTADSETRSQVRGYGTDGWISTATNPIGEQVGYAWDLVGHPDKVTRPDGNFTDWNFDDARDAMSLTPPGREPHLFENDPNSKLLVRDTPPAISQPAPALLAGQQSYEYGSEHELKAITRSDGRNITFAYTPEGRLSTQTLSSATLSFGYSSWGALTSVKRSDGVNLAMTYDGPLWTSSSWSGAISGSVKADYDADLWLKSLTVNDSSTVSFTYDKDGLLIGAGSGAASSTMVVTRDPHSGLVLGTSIGNVITSNQYNGFGEPKALTATVGGNVLFTQTIERDKLGRVKHISEMVQGVVHELEYAYDNLGRLVSETRDGVATTYAYDLNGNRTGVTANGEALTATYDAQDRIVTYGNSSFEMSPHGDLLQKTGGSAGIKLSYDELGNLLEATVSSGTASRTVGYVVDGFGRRVARKVDGQFDKSWLYRDALRPVSEVDSNGTFKHFVYVETRSGAPDFLIQNGIVCRLIKDHLGSVRLAVDAETGEVVQALDYDAYGVVLSDSDPGFQPFGFAGGLYDQDTRLVRFGARDYSAGIGRWTNKDPIGFGGGDTNVYAYVGGDPVNRVDPTGKFFRLAYRSARGLLLSRRLGQRGAIEALKRLGKAGGVWASSRREGIQLAQKQSTLAGGGGRHVVHPAGITKDGVATAEHAHALDASGNQLPGHIWWGGGLGQFVTAVLDADGDGEITAYDVLEFANPFFWSSANATNAKMLGTEGAI